MPADRNRDQSDDRDEETTFSGDSVNAQRKNPPLMPDVAEGGPGEYKSTSRGDLAHGTLPPDRE